MSNAPPTPPPTSATEIQDNARSDGAAVAPAATTSSESASQDSYQAAFTTISSLAAQGSWKELIEVAEEAELSGSSGSSHLLITVPLILGYLISDNLLAAKYVFQRLSSPHQSNGLVVQLMKLVTASLERRHSSVYTMAKSLYDQTAQAAPEDQGLANVVAAMLTAFTESFRARTIVLLSKAYASIPLSLAQIYIGLPQDQLVTTAESYNWTFDPSSQVLYPKPIGTTALSKGHVPGSSLSTFEYVTTSVAHLEM